MASVERQQNKSRSTNEISFFSGRRDASSSSAPAPSLASLPMSLVLDDLCSSRRCTLAVRVIAAHAGCSRRLVLYSYYFLLLFLLPPFRRSLTAAHLSAAAHWG